MRRLFVNFVPERTPAADEMRTNTYKQVAESFVSLLNKATDTFLSYTTDVQKA